MLKKSPLLAFSISAASLLSACGGGQSDAVASIQNMGTITKLVSTVAPNGDGNPYGLAIAPANYTGINAATGAKNVLQPGDVLVSNFSNSAGANTGTTIMRYVPGTGSISQFYQEKAGAGPVAMAISNLGATWIANFLPGYSNPNAGTTTGNGNVVVVTPNGTDFPNGTGVIDNSSGATFNPVGDQFAGPWGQAFGIKAGTAAPYFFVTQVNSGSIQRQKFVPGQFARESVVTIGKLPVGTNTLDPTGPQGMVYDASTDVLFVVSTASNSIVAFPNATTTPGLEASTIVYQGTPLNAPVGLTINPLTGSLLVVNQLDNNLVEILPNSISSPSGMPTFNGQLIGVKLLDSTPVDAVKGTGSALFGVAATKDAAGNLRVYFTNSNTNTLNVFQN